MSHRAAAFMAFGCAAITKEGTPCPNSRAGRSKWCGLHDPKIGHRARRSGGRTRAAQLRRLMPAQTVVDVRLQSHTEIIQTLEAVARAVCTGRLDVRTAHSTLNAANTALNAIRGERRAAAHDVARLTDDEIEATIEDELEALAAKRTS